MNVTELLTLQNDLNTILNDDNNETKNVNLLVFFNKNKNLMKEETKDGRTFIHSMARVIEGKSYNKCNNFKDFIVWPFTREPAYKLKKFLISKDASEDVKNKFRELFKNTYKTAIANDFTPKRLAENCDKDFDNFMSVDDNNNGVNDDNSNGNDNIISINRIEEYENDKIFNNLEELYDYRNIISDESIFKIMVGSYTGALRIGTYKITNRDDIFKKYENKDDEIIINCECLSERTYNNTIAFHSDSPTTKICNNNNIEIVCEKENGYSFTMNNDNVKKITMMIVHKNQPQGGKIKNIRITKSHKSKKSRKTRKSKKSRKSRKHRKSKKHRRSHRR